ncbi:MAG: response regulator [Thermodesulfobacteriota bacterium]
MDNATRILIIDDDRDVWQAFRDVLSPEETEEGTASRRMDSLLGRRPPAVGQAPAFELVFADQGEDGYQKVVEARQEDRPYAVAFVDVRMPPGWDGVKTATAIRATDPAIELVIVTAYADRSREEMVAAIGAPERLLFLRKPFDADELLQMALSLSSKWRLARQEEATRQELASSRARFRDLVETISDFVWEMDSQGRYTYCSPVCSRLFGRSPDELLGQFFSQALLPEVDRQTCHQHLQHCVATGRGYAGLERSCLHADGRTVFVESSAMPVLNERGALIGFRGIDRDITERKREEIARAQLEEQYRQSQKMEALGTLAGGIAHDLNNVLAPIIMSAELIAMGLGPQDPVRDRLRVITESAQRAADLIRQILVFSRKQVLEPKVVDLNRVINAFFKLLRRLMRSDLEIVLELEPELWPVDADVSMMEQVILNLMVNARDAIHGQGRIELRTRNETVEQPIPDVEHRLFAGSFVVLSVTDDGCGMNEAVQARIFDPFFTTKAAGKGTGLGLSTVYGIVTQHGGHLRLVSRPEAGSTFSVYLPRSAHTTQGAEAAIHQVPRGGTETILLVEDNDEVRRMAASTMEAYGYRVLTAVNGAQGLEVFRRNPGLVHLLLTDIVMPQLDGRSLADMVRAERPELPVILMSAYPPDFVAENVAPFPFQFLQKPFRPADLARLLRNVLDQERKGTWMA